MDDFDFLEASFDAALELAFGLASAATALCGELDRPPRVGEHALSGDFDLSLRDTHR